LGNFRIFWNYAKEWMRSPGEDTSSGREPCQPNSRAISATTRAYGMLHRGRGKPPALISHPDAITNLILEALAV
jgi:hypothetical protein